LIIFFSPSVLTGSGDDSAKIFDAKSGTNKRTFRGHVGSVNALVVSEPPNLD